MLHAKCQVLRSWRRRFVKVSHHIWAWLPSWSCDLDHLYKLLFSFPRRLYMKFWVWLAKRFQRRRCLNIVDDDNDDYNDHDADDGRRTMGLVELKKLEILRGFLNTVTYISAAKYPRLPNLVSNRCLDIATCIWSRLLVQNSIVSI